MSRAADEVRTRDIQLGRLTLYQLSYHRFNRRSLGEGGSRFLLIFNRRSLGEGGSRFLLIFNRRSLGEGGSRFLLIFNRRSLGEGGFKPFPNNL